jgi:hypothetical protein
MGLTLKNGIKAIGSGTGGIRVELRPKRIMVQSLSFQLANVETIRPSNINDEFFGVTNTLIDHTSFAVSFMQRLANRSVGDFQAGLKECIEAHLLCIFTCACLRYCLPRL